MKTLGGFVVLGALLLGACNPRTPAAGPGSGSTGNVAELKDARITAAELDAKVKNQLLQLRQQEYDLKRQALDELLQDLLLKREALQRGISKEELLRQEVAAKVPEPSDFEIETLYARVRGQVGNQPLQVVRPQLVSFLQQRAVQARLGEFRRGLQVKENVKLLLEPPRFEVNVASDAPSQGPAGAPVTIVEYTDFQCPYCRRGQETVDQVLVRFKDKVRVVHRDYPLDNHPRARPAAQASYCAGEQGRFWEYRRSLLLQGGELGDADLHDGARKLNLDAAAFKSCLQAGRHDDVIQKSLLEGQSLGVASTPTFFINGRMLLGARSVEEFATVIEEELARTPRS